METVLTSPSMTNPSGSVISHRLRKKFEIVAISSGKPPTYTIKDEQNEIIVDKFYQEELINVI